MSEKDVVRLPPMNIKLGSCPLCGKNIWSDYEIKPNSNTFKCTLCKKVMHLDDIIPF